MGSQVRGDHTMAGADLAVDQIQRLAAVTAQAVQHDQWAPGSPSRS